ncbi:MAG: LexA family protein [Pseudomonadota bacterium]
MTRLDLQVLDYVRTHIERTGVAPTIREIGAAVGKRGIRSIYNSLDRLVAAGKLERARQLARGLSLVGATDLTTATTEALKAELGRRGVTGAALERPERVAIGPARHCAVAGCGEEVPMGHAFCLSHWRAISPGSQRALMDAHGWVRRLRSGRERDIALAAYQAAYSQALVEAERREQRRDDAGCAA